MSSQITDLAEQVLQNETDFIVPIKRIWLMLSLMGKVDDIGFESFSLMLKEDDRFEVFENYEDDIDEKQIENLEEFGYFMGPRVMLKSRRPGRKEVGAMLIKKASLIFEHLRKAWEIRDKDDKKEEDQLLYALASAQKLLKLLKDEFPESDLGGEKN